MLTVNDPFDLPEVYKKTKLSGERWQLMADKEKGILFMCSDNDLRLASKCKFLACDGTFDVCSRNFNQLFTIIGLVCRLLLESHLTFFSYRVAMTLMNGSLLDTH